MQTLTIELADAAAARLREEAARRNASVEDFAARLLSERFRPEFDVTDEELGIIQEAVEEVRTERRNLK